MDEVRSILKSKLLARAVAGTALALTLAVATTMPASAAGHHIRSARAGIAQSGSTEGAGNSMVGGDFDPMNIKRIPPYN